MIKSANRNDSGAALPDISCTPHDGRFALAVILVLLIATTSLLGLTACDKPAPAPMRIGTNVWPGYEPLYLARELGYLGDDVRLIEHTSASQVMRDFRNDVLEAATLTLDEVLQLAQTNKDLRIALIMDISHGGDAIVARSTIQDMHGLRGKLIGVEHTALGAFMLTRGLQSVGLDISDVNIVPRRSHEHRDAFLNGEVDAVVTFEPTRTQLLQAGARVIFDSTQIPDEIVDVLVVRASYWDKHPQRIDALLGVWFKTIARMRAEPDMAAPILARRLRVPTDSIAGIYEGLRLPDPAENRRMLISEGGPPPLAVTAHALYAIMFRERLLYGEPDINALFPTAQQWHVQAMETQTE